MHAGCGAAATSRAHFVSPVCHDTDQSTTVLISSPLADRHRSGALLPPLCRREKGGTANEESTVLRSQPARPCPEAVAGASPASPAGPAQRVTEARGSDVCAAVVYGTGGAAPLAAARRGVLVSSRTHLDTRHAAAAVRRRRCRCRPRGALSASRHVARLAARGCAAAALRRARAQAAAGALAAAEPRKRLAVPRLSARRRKLRPLRCVRRFRRRRAA